MIFYSLTSHRAYCEELEFQFQFQNDDSLVEIGLYLLIELGYFTACGKDTRNQFIRNN